MEVITKKKSKYVVLGIIRNEENQYLISQRYDLKVADSHLKWDLPGGTNEFGESLEQTLEREILEETGLHVEVQGLFPKTVSKVREHADYKMHVVLFCFNCKLLGGTIHLNDPKINDLKWVNQNEFKNFDFLSTAQVFINMIGK